MCIRVPLRQALCVHMQFFGCYFNLFRLMAKCGVLQNLLLKEHVHTFVNAGGDVRELDFRFFLGDRKIGAPFHGLKAFFTTPQLSTLDKVCSTFFCNIPFAPCTKIDALLYAGLERQYFLP